jgi:hypothetical protein
LEVIAKALARMARVFLIDAWRAALRIGRNEQGQILPIGIWHNGIDTLIQGTAH